MILVKQIDTYLLKDISFREKKKTKFINKQGTHNSFNAKYHTQ